MVKQKQLDDALVTLVNYTGWLLTVVLVAFTIVIALTKGPVVATALSPAYMAAAGMIIYKGLHYAAKEPDK